MQASIQVPAPGREWMKNSPPEAVKTSPHAEQAQPGIRLDRIGIESRPLIRNAQPQRAGNFIQLDKGATATTVFVSVSNGFLGDAEKAERGFLRLLALEAVVHNLNFHCIARPEILAEILEGLHQAQ